MRYPLRVISSRSDRVIHDLLNRAGVDPEGIGILRQKITNMVIRVDGVPAPGANIIKQQLLSLGGDAAVHRDVIEGRPDESTLFIIADRRRLLVLAEKLQNQPFGLSGLGARINSLLCKYNNLPSGISLPEGKIDFTGGPVIMGVLNVTPDSFHDGGRHLDPGRATDRALEMVEQGAGIIDVGGESSRPGSSSLGEEEELARILPVLERLAGTIPVPVSIDTRKAGVAEAAMKSGASIINDISGLGDDPGIVRTAVETGAAVVIMHMQGTPDTMQENPVYEDAVSEIIEWLEGRTGELVSKGIRHDKIIVDPGIGFGKRLADNLEILDGIGSFHALGFPVLVGYSRKSFIGMITGRGTGERLHGGFAALGACMEQGVQIVRVHDVKETADFISVWNAINNRGNER